MKSTGIKTPSRNRQMNAPIARRMTPLLTVLIVLLLWQWISANRLISPILVPAPADVMRAFRAALADGSLLKHTSVTLGEMLGGLLIGLSVGLALGYAIAKAPWLESALSPIIVALQSTPIVAYAPLLVIWFGTGPASKVVTTAVIVFFPTLVNAIVGIRGVSPRLRDLMRSLGAGRWRMFALLELPSALPVILAGLKTSATLAVIGAVVGEFVGSGSGLGVLVIMARSQYNTALVVVTVLTMTAIALSLYSLVALAEWRFLVWQRRAAA